MSEPFDPEGVHCDETLPPDLGLLRPRQPLTDEERADLIKAVRKNYSNGVQPPTVLVLDSVEMTAEKVRPSVPLDPYAEVAF
jgi:hypothetical protein